MAETTLVTQSSLETIKGVEAALASNLDAHVNASLSKAHGLILYNLPHPFYDSYGNDLSYYADSGGDRVGYSQMRITDNNVSYYAPLESTALSGQDTTTGVISSTSLTTEPVIAGNTALVTDFTLNDEADLIFTNNSILLPHTRFAHWETHTAAVYQISPSVILDSAGHTVANYVARLSFNGVVLYIPCDTRLGGPLQPPRSPLIPSAISAKQRNDPNYMNLSITCSVTGGTLPMTFQWQYDTGGGNKLTPTPNGIWANFTTGGGTQVIPQGSLPGWGAPQDLILYNQTSAASPILLIIQTHPQNPNKASVMIRCLVTNPAGTVASNSLAFSTYD